MSSCSKKVRFVLLLVVLTGIFSVKNIIIERYKNNLIDKSKEVLINLDIKKQNELKDLINIDSLSEEFMNNYFEEVSKISTEDKENILIVISSKSIENTHGASNIIEAPNNQYYLVYDSENKKNNALKKLKKDSDIISVEENMVSTIDGELDDISSYNSWSITKLGYDDAINEISSISSSEPERINEVIVAIIDSGVDQELFRQKYPDKLLYTHDVIFPGESRGDTNGHGTHIAGTIAESTPSNVKILAVKTDDRDNIPNNADDGTYYQIDLLNALNYIVQDKKADVISHSIGGYDWSTQDSASYYQTIQAAVDKGIIFVSSAGNTNNELFHYPSSYNNVISVSAVDSHLEKAGFSNYGAGVTFAAPGYKITSINATEKGKTKSGTSVATPHVTSAVAILKSFNKDLTLEQTISLLEKHAIDIGDDGFDEKYGYGVISFEDAVFCSNNVVCDDYGVFEKDDTKYLSTIKIESAGTFTPEYNYGSITNIGDAQINLYYTEDDYYTKTLSQVIENIEIIGYEPYNYGQQSITIKYKDLETVISIDNSKLKDGWEYQALNDGTIELTNILYTTKSLEKTTYSVNDVPQVIVIPTELDGKNISSLGEGVLKDKSFRSKGNIKRVFIPSGIKNIGKNAFSIGYSNYIETTRQKKYFQLSPIEIVFPETIESIDTSAFKVETAENVFVNNDKVVFYAYKNSAAHNYAVDNDINYMYVDEIIVNLSNNNYKAFDKINPEDLTVTVNYVGSLNTINSQIVNNYIKNYNDDGTTLESLSEVINNYTIKYNNGNDSLRSGDTSFTIEFDTNVGYHIEEEVSITVAKIEPEYTIPSELTAQIGQTLSEIELPTGFKWEDETIVLDDLGENIFKAIYEPLDKENYAKVENIDIPILVNKANSNILYSSSGNIVKYDGEAHGINLSVESPDNAIIKYMDKNGNYTLDEMPKYTEIGEHLIKFRIFIDNKHTDITGEEILKIINNTIINNTMDYEVIYDGQEHSIKINIGINNYDIKYSIDNINYNLNALPKFKDVGEYTVYYRINCNGYDELLGNNKVKIYGIKSFKEPVIKKNNILILNNNSFNNLKNNIDIYSPSKTFQHLDINKKLLISDNIKTGEFIKININNSKNYEYQLAYIGDVNGDGKMDIFDYIRIMKYIMDEIELSGANKEAADVNGDGKIDIFDYIRIMKKIMEEN